MHVFEEFRQAVQQCTGVRPGRTEAVDLLLESALGPNGWYRLERDGGASPARHETAARTPAAPAAAASRAQQAGLIVTCEALVEHTAESAAP